MSETKAPLPARPYVPFTFYLMVTDILLVRLVLSRGDGWRALGVIACLGTIAGAGLTLVARHHRHKGGHMGTMARMVCVLVLSSLLAVLVATTALGRLDACESLLSERPVSEWELRITTEGRATVGGQRCQASVSVDGVRRGDVWVTTQDEYGIGMMIRGVGRFSPNADDEFSRSNRLRGIAGSVRMVRVQETREPEGVYALVMAAREGALRLIDPDADDARAIVAGSICGSRRAMDARGLTDDFATCGVAHLVAVSGGHLAIVSSVAARLLALTALAPSARAVLLLACDVLFVVFCGAPVSAVRALLMVLASSGAQLVGRRNHSLSCACVVAASIVLVDPFAAGQLGFLLSVSSVVGLCLFSPYAAYALRALLPRRPRSVPWRLPCGRALSRAFDAFADITAATLVAQVVTLPIVGPAFGSFALVSTVANLVLGPLFELLITAGLLACVAPLAPVRVGALLVCDGSGSLAADAVRRMSRIPLASLRVDVPGWVLWLVVVTASALLVWRWPKVNPRKVRIALGGAAAVLSVLLVRWALFAPPSVRILDVGQGDAILVQDGPSAVLVDSGPDERVADELARLHVFRLDAVVLTHLHDDHYGGMSSLCGVVRCDRVIVARGVREHLSGEAAEAVRRLVGDRVEEVSWGDGLRVGNFGLRVIWPEQDVDGSHNADSIELYLSYRDGDRILTGLLTGDAERDETGPAVSHAHLGKLDFLKVGHHGSEVSIGDGTARTISPELSVASAGEGNRYGHPSATCIDTLERVGSRFLCTKDVGTVELLPEGGGFLVRTARPRPAPDVA